MQKYVMRLNMSIVYRYGDSIIIENLLIDNVGV